jgi:hypothetical protein
MDYLGQSGEKALVNDRGRILRLPFAGDGQPPEPGTRINPKRDSCCCPKSVDLMSKQEDHKRSDPRRTSDKNKNGNLVFMGIDSPVDRDLWVSEFKGHKIKLLLYPLDTIITPLPTYWLYFDIDKNKVNIVDVMTKATTIYLYSRRTFGSLGNHDNNLNEKNELKSIIRKFYQPQEYDQILDKLTRSHPRPRSIRIHFKVFDIWDNLIAVEHDINKEKKWVKKFKEIHPNTRLSKYNHYVKSINGKGDGNGVLEPLKDWYKKPEDKRYKYVRIY